MYPWLPAHLLEHNINSFSAKVVRSQCSNVSTTCMASKTTSKWRLYIVRMNIIFILQNTVMFLHTVGFWMLIGDAFVGI